MKRGVSYCEQVFLGNHNKGSHISSGWLSLRAVCKASKLPSSLHPVWLVDSRSINPVADGLPTSLKIGDVWVAPGI